MASCVAGNEKIINMLQQQLVAQQESSANVIEVLHQQLQQGSSKTFEVLHQELGQQRETDLKVSTCQSLGGCTGCSSDDMWLQQGQQHITLVRAASGNSNTWHSAHEAVAVQGRHPWHAHILWKGTDIL